MIDNNFTIIIVVAIICICITLNNKKTTSVVKRKIDLKQLLKDDEALAEYDEVCLIIKKDNSLELKTTIIDDNPLDY